MLKTGCIKTEPHPDDGVRISVMSRHTLNDGITSDPEITADLYDEWWSSLAPPLRLLGNYYKRHLPWDQFEVQYREFLMSNDKATQALGRLALLAVEENVTILCIEADPEHCHRRLIAEACQQLSPDLEVSLK